ncbi:MOSC domain-containing protein [Amycolatopsis sp. SID8362]|uniref:MOSC domain-containing protein n=1 Tax=Amycolatopsis sp. SID8362 TaxID=2690346 RepID=UPI00136A6AE3|nr:MOSC domain-containing protein [Amycolatopsis sp. SID8362]NBH10064.1 MOSC domain-containing protein [Amycolatopsis sp. SID8362]NED46758.1 MOSC domain-containing protein [Amycolatopsis sp. SID8362]
MGVVAALWRYPVKSMAGERLAEVTVGERGLEGDRLYAVRDASGKLGSGKNSARFRRMPGLHAFAARYDGDVPVVTFPDGRVLPGTGITTELAGALSIPGVELAKEGEIPHHDEAPVHLVTTSSLAWLAERAPGVVLDERRFRANVLLDTGSSPERAEESWVGARVRLGEVELEVLRKAVRCVMVGLPCDGLPAAPGLLKTISEVNEVSFGVQARVVRGGVLRVGDVHGVGCSAPHTP